MMQLPTVPFFQQFAPFSPFYQKMLEQSEDWIQVCAKWNETLPSLIAEWPQETKMPDMPQSIFSPLVALNTLQEFCQTLQENPENMFDYSCDIALRWQDYFSKPLKDRRFQHPIWEDDPFFQTLKKLYAVQTHTLMDLEEKLKKNSSPAVKRLIFYIRQVRDAFCPANFAFTNPEFLETTLQTKGENLVQGVKNFLEDLNHGMMRLSDMNAFRVGENLASSQGKVVFQNDLFQLIQYSPLTESVYEIPLLIIPPWINKFYIFDLQPDTSFIQWLLKQGWTVFIVSWVNPTQHHIDKTFHDYVLEGAYTALKVVLEKCKVPNAHLLGYCAGGISSYCLLAYLAKNNQSQLIKSASTLATPIHFSNAGDVLAYVCETQINELEKMMKKSGYLDGKVLYNSFNLLRPKDLIWNTFINHYLLGKEPMAFDLLFWNSDTVRLPAQMHSFYLREFFLQDKLVKPNAFDIGGTPIDLSAIKNPLFVMATIEDHIAPWQSVFPHFNFNNDKTTFLLGGSGHVAGIMNPPSKNKYHYWFNDSSASILNPNEWFENAQQVAGSWWPFWHDWLRQFGDTMVKAREVYEGLENAPGSYVIAP